MDFTTCKLSLQNASGQKCLILDCCYAAAVAFDPNWPVCEFEVLAACGFDTLTSARKHQRFTRALTKALEAQNGGPITLAGLNMYLVRNYVNRKLSTTPWHGVIGSSHSLISFGALDRRAARDQ